MNKKSFNKEYKTPAIRFIALQALSLIASSFTGGGVDPSDEDDWGDL